VLTRYELNTPVDVNATVLRIQPQELTPPCTCRAAT
jgi:hypothetical protein